jgi:polyhydroxyalkanoate synthesis regulator phasin
MGFEKAITKGKATFSTQKTAKVVKEYVKNGKR